MNKEMKDSAEMKCLEEMKHSAALDSMAGIGAVRWDVSMKPYTTMRVGGQAAALVEVANVGVLSQLLRFLSRNGIPHAVFGNGSNLIVADEGYQGVLLHIASGLSQMKVLEDGIESEAGALLGSVAKLALANGFSGLEFASGIPGSLGGAVAINAGAYGREMKDVVMTTSCLDRNGESVILFGNDHGFGYRHSRIQSKNLIAVSTRLQLKHGLPESILEQMKDYAARRADKQPLDYPSAGSTFKRPEGYFTGKLIEDCGLKGMRVGGAQVSEKHAGFIVNTGTATATDVVSLIQLIREKVMRETGILLEPEVKLLKGDQICSF